MDLTENNFQMSLFRGTDEIPELSERGERLYFHEQSVSAFPLSEIFLLVIDLLVLEC